MIKSSTNFAERHTEFLRRSFQIIFKQKPQIFPAFDPDPAAEFDLVGRGEGIGPYVIDLLGMHGALAPEGEPSIVQSQQKAGQQHHGSPGLHSSVHDRRLRWYCMYTFKGIFIKKTFRFLSSRVIIV